MEIEPRYIRNESSPLNYSTVIEKKKQKSVLVIDDDEIDCFSLKSTISKLGDLENCQMMPSGFSGLHYLEYLGANADRWPDLIFLELNMEVLDGYEFIQQMKFLKVKQPAKTKICLVSSCIMNEKIYQLLIHNIAIHYIQKPIHLNDIQYVLTLSDSGS